MGLSVCNPVIHEKCLDGFPLEFFAQLFCGFFAKNCMLVFTEVSGSEI